MLKSIKNSWREHLNDEFQKEYMQELNSFLENEIAKGKSILPPKEFWFEALNITALEDVKVVILGQDPYPTKGHAHGLCFSVLEGVKPLPKSLLNINKELIFDLNIDNSQNGNLKKWGEQGVLLLNAVLTVEEGKANAHKNKGWEIFTTKIIELINEKCDNVVFILWGGYAQKKGSFIDQKRHLIIKTPHPSPLSAYRGFFESRPFSQTNDYLALKDIDVIDWKV